MKKITTTRLAVAFLIITGLLLNSGLFYCISKTKQKGIHTASKFTQADSASGREGFVIDTTIHTDDGDLIMPEGATLGGTLIPLNTTVSEQTLFGKIDIGRPINRRKLPSKWNATSTQESSAFALGVDSTGMIITYSISDQVKLKDGSYYQVWQYTDSSFVIEDSIGTAAIRNKNGDWYIIDAKRALEAYYKIDSTRFDAQLNKE